MKALIALFLFWAPTSFATVDANDRVYIVVQHVQDDTDFFVERVPIIGCYGLAKGAALAQFTLEYKATSNIGCGDAVAQDNINALSCAKLVDSKESADYSTFSHVTLDISKCPAKDNPKFITMVRTAAKLNFSNKKNTVQLKLIR